MDREELKSRLNTFRERCSAKSKPLEDLCVEEAFPGDTSTSYIVKVKATWVDDMTCSEALDFLYDTLWETTDVPTREKVFSIFVLDSQNELHCAQDRESRKK